MEMFGARSRSTSATLFSCSGLRNANRKPTAHASAPDPADRSGSRLRLPNPFPGKVRLQMASPVILLQTVPNPALQLRQRPGQTEMEVQVAVIRAPQGQAQTKPFAL